MFDLVIDAKPDNYRLFEKRNSDPKFDKFREQILERDNYQCQFCNFTSKKHMHVVNLNGNYFDNRTTNLVSACPLCSQCLFLDMCGKYENSGGFIIYLPEISQKDLNALSHVIFLAQNLEPEMRKVANNILNSLKLRTQHVEKNFGKGMSNPFLLGHVMIDAPLKNQANMYTKIGDQLRLLANPEVFKNYAYDWAKESIQKKEVNS